ncbi:MAG: nucleotidyltransferase domain-containing protein [Candidatus Falkowbacteria bacterium]
MISLKSNIVVKVLGYYFINPKARHYVRELAGLLKVDPGNLSKKMAELKKEGIFLVEGEGKNRYFTLNENFPLLNEYKNIYEAKFGVAESLVAALKSIEGLTEAYLFGSYVKGNFEDGSDIDLLVVGSHDHVQVSRCLASLEKRWHREINMVDFSKEEFDRKMKDKDSFLENIFSSKTIKII